MKHLRTYNEQSELCNESLRDEMKPMSDEQIKDKVGDEKFEEYKKLTELEEFLNKKPFTTCEILNNLPDNLYPETLTDTIKLYLKSPPILDIVITYSDGKYIFKGKGLHTDNIDGVINILKDITTENIERYRKKMTEHIEERYKEMEKTIKEVSIIYTNF